MKKIKFSVILLLLFGSIASSQIVPADSLYLGQIPPGNTVVVFAPGLISLSNRRETKIVFSPNNKECLIGIGKNSAFRILYSNYYSGYWTVPVPADFITSSWPIEPFFSPDSLHIFFTSNANIYVCSRQGQTWSAPVQLGSPVNTNYEEYHPTVTSDRTLYFCSTRDNGQLDIYRSQSEDGNYLTVQKIDGVINRHDSQQNGAWDPFIASDESYIIFTAIRAEGYGHEDQYISFNKNGKWTNPKNLGPSINTSLIEYGSYISPDYQYYFFSRPAGWGPNSPADIYWVKIDNLIDSLMQTNYVPYVRNLIPDQTDTVGHPFAYTIPDSIFLDDDGNHTLRFSALLSNGNPLPSWLSLDSLTRMFSGIPTVPETLNIKVTATDTAMVSVSVIFKLTIVPQPIHVDDDQGSIPNKLRLYPNYPNPFNPSTTIEFSLAEKEFVSLKIYNSLGQLATTLLDQAMIAGKHQVQWNAVGQASGVYMYCLQAGNNKITRKLLLLK